MKRLTTIVGALAIAILTLWLLRYFYLRYVYVITDNAFQEADMVQVSVQDVSGKIIKLFKDEFQPVKEGEVLFKIDDAVYRKNVESLEKQLLSLKARKEGLYKRLLQLKEQLPAAYRASVENLRSLLKELEELKRQEIIEKVNWKTSVAKARSGVKAAEKELEASLTSYKYWKRQLERYKNLYDRKVISKKRFEEVELSYKEAVSRLQASKAALNSAKQNLKMAKSLRERVEIVKKKEGSLSHRISALREQVKISRAKLIEIEETEDSIKELEAKISSIKRNFEKAKILLSRTFVKSPVSGFVAKKWKNEGDFVSPGLPVYSVYDPESFYVLAWIDEDKLRTIGVESNSRVYLESCGSWFNGKVASIGSSAGSPFALIPRDTSQGDYTKVTQRVPVKITLEGVPISCIKPGTNVTVFVQKG